MVLTGTVDRLWSGVRDTGLLGLFAAIVEGSAVRLSKPWNDVSWDFSAPECPFAETGTGF
jgi:hypothetical protein